MVFHENEPNHSYLFLRLINVSTTDMSQKLICSATATLIGFVLWKIGKHVVHQLTSPLRNINGPKSTSWLFGNVRDVFKSEEMVLLEEWAQEYGQTLKYYGPLNEFSLFTMDLRALNHILTHSMDYQKPKPIRYFLAEIIGNKGVVCVEGPQHRQQRRIMNPAFGPGQMRDLTEIILTKSIKLRDILMLESKDEERNPKRTDILGWMTRVSLDVIGLAGFNYEFNSLDTSVKKNEINEAIGMIVSAGIAGDVLSMLQLWLPPLRAIPTDLGRKITVAQQAMERIGRELLRDAKAAVMASQRDEKKGIVEKRSVQGRDLLSLLVRANMATDIPDNQKLSDEEVLAQVPTFLVTGHETTSAAMTWALFALTQHPEVQAKLRQELITVESETPSMDELLALPYLDGVVREALRVHPPVPCTIRVAMKDDILPLDTPITDNNGKVLTEIKVRKGDYIAVPILAINRSEAIWGPDAKEFKPERWESPPENASNIPGVWGHLLTFIGGPRACVAYRFALIEMKALLFTLVRNFEFELAVPAGDIVMRAEMVQHPFLRSEPGGNSQMPLFIKPYHRA
ncbi:cytochrome P450 [Hygrophoropsis aurantiaca]|uniref:Cytochrome P450 n=1 Tax=Hygrophoropsis aurantiaca TaxID=72124 RepID=A0ACB8A459_9AGAM|nr:cytochrome P450 [Hygrophoropsis aurantiaca]